MSNALKLIAVLAVSYIFVTMILGLEMFTMLGLIGFAAVVFLAKGFTKFANMVPTNRKTSQILGGGFMVLLFIMGGFASIGLGSFSLPGASIAPTGEAPGASENECWSLASDELRGKSSSVVQNAYDQESDTPNSAAVDVNPTYVYKNGEYHTTLTDTSDASLTTAAVGQVLEYYPAGTTYYGDYSSKCVLTQADEISLDVHTIVSDANMDVVCYDDTGSAALSAAGNTTQSDYDITMGAEETTRFYCKWKVNTNNVAFNFGGIVAAYYEGTSDTVDQIDVIGNDGGVSFSSKTVPKFAKNTVISVDGQQGETNSTNGYEDYWEADSPLLLSEWDTIKVEFEVVSGGTDPSADTDSVPDTKTAVYIYGIDSQWSRGDDGEPFQGTHTNDADEDNVGLSEILWSPVGGTLGTAIELI